MPLKCDPSGTAKKPVAMVVCAMLLFLSVPVSALDLSMDSPRAVTPAISKGDSVFVHGTATGHPSNGLQVWLIGNNYATVSPVSVNGDNTFSYELKPSQTQNLAQGQYFVLVQHPMMNGEFDVAYNENTGKVTSLKDGTVLFTLTGSSRLQASDGASALMNAVGSQNIDDTFSAVSFFISPPATSIDPIGDHAVGDAFVITGPTNLAAGDALMVEIISSSFHPTTKLQSGEFTGATGTVYVQAGSAGYNRWSFAVDTTGWKPDEYSVSVSAVIQDATASTTFTLAEYKPPVTTVPDGSMATTTAPSTISRSITEPPLMTTPAAPSSLITVFAGSLSALFLARWNRGKL